MLSSGVITYVLLDELQIFTNKSEEDKYREQINSLIETIKSKIQRERDLSTSSEIKIYIVNDAQTTDEIGEEYFNSIMDEVKNKERIYKFLLIISEDRDLLEMYIKRSGFTAGVERDKLYINQDRFDLNDSDEVMWILTHELMHIIQYSNFELVNPKFMDQKIAWMTVIEGDADFTAIKVTNKTDRQEIIESYKKIQDPLLSIQLFPYIFGQGFIEEIYVRGGWNLVNKLYVEPPESTEQILHISKYLIKENPEKVEVNKLNDEWEVLMSDTMGEYFIQIMLKNWIHHTDAEEAATGWGGDNLTLFRMGETNILMWKIVWDSEQDAQNFYQTFNTMLEINDSNIIVREDKRQDWSYNLGVISVLIDGEDVYIIASDRDLNIKKHKLNN